jgi:hypothetical protein
MKLMARASSSIRAMPAPEPEPEVEKVDTPETQANLAQVAAALNSMPIPPASGPRAVPATAAASPAVTERFRPLGPAPLPVQAPTGEDRGSNTVAMPNSSRIALISS